MKVLKKILIVLAALILLIVVVGFFMPATMDSEQKITIKAKPEIVFAHVNNLRNWHYWAKWNMIDPNMKVEYNGAWKGKDSGYSWESEDPMVGAGTLTVVESVANESIKTRIDFRDWDGANGQMKLSPTENGVEVTWTFNGDDVGMNLVGRYFNGLFKGAIDADLMEGLENLKRLSESQSMAMEIDMMPETLVAFTTAQGTKAEVTPLLAQHYGMLAGHIAGQGAEMAMMPMANYLEYTDEKVLFHPTIAIDKQIESTDAIQVRQMPEQKMAVFHHYGPYHNLEAANTAAQQYLDALGISYNKARLEIYETDPGMEPDPDKWLTKICFKLN